MKKQLLALVPFMILLCFLLPAQAEEASSWMSGQSCFIFAAPTWKANTAAPPATWRKSRR